MPRWPTGPFSTHRTGCYGCMRVTSRDGSCGVHGYPCLHYGMDLFADDSLVVAPDAGRVVAVSDGSRAPWSGYGPGVVAIKGQSGRYLVLAHLARSSIKVEVGQLVQEGQPLARYDAGAGHTHFEVRRELTGPSSSNTVDPTDWIEGRSRIVSIALLGLVLWGSWWLLEDAKMI